MAAEREGATPIAPELVIGVIGHRRTGAQEALANTARQARDQLLARMPGEGREIALVVVTSLAEGVDQWLTRILLERPGTALDVVLPCARTGMAASMAVPAARREFDDLLALARHVEEPEDVACGDAAFLAASRRVVDQCDVLMVVWDGEPERGPGGTGGAVEYATKTGCPLVWIRENGSSFSEEGELFYNRPALARLRAFTAERLDDAAWRRACDQERAALRRLQPPAGMSPIDTRTEAAGLLAWQVRCDLLAQRYQRLSCLGGTVLYLLSALAILCLAAQALLWPARHFLTVVEVLAMAVILFTVHRGERRRWHGRWMDYRHLAERLRAAFFMRIAGFHMVRRRASSRAGGWRAGHDWVPRALAQLWWRAPRLTVTSDDDSAVRTFIRQAWLERQRDYFRRAAEREQRAYHRLERAGLALFMLALAAAVLHLALGWMEHGGGEGDAGRWISFVGLVAPAFGAAFAGIRSQREYEQNARRNLAMAESLDDLIDRLAAATDRAAMGRVLEDADRVLLEENQDWRYSISFRRLETPM